MEKCEASKRYGGLGLGLLNEKNVALLKKWWWRFNVERVASWKKVVCDKYRISYNSLCHEVPPIYMKLSKVGKGYNSI